MARLPIVLTIRGSDADRARWHVMARTEARSLAGLTRLILDGLAADASLRAEVIRVGTLAQPSIRAASETTAAIAPASVPSTASALGER